VRVPRVLGHRDTNSTACPGSALYYQLDDLRSRVATGEPLPGVATFLTASLSSPSIRWGGSATMSGTLTDASLAPLAGRPVRVEVLRGSHWRLLAEPATDAAGAWSTTVLPRRTRLLRATYAGDSVWRRSFSPEQVLRLKPLVALEPGAVTGVRGRRVRLSGTVTPRKRRVYQVLQQRIRGAYRQVGVKALRVRGGRFRSSFVPAFAASYRVYVLARADAVTSSARSPLRSVRVSPSPASASRSRARGR
jgi:hypothetical protein